MKSTLAFHTGRVQKRFAAFFRLIVFITILGTTAFSAPPMQNPPNVGTWEDLKEMGFSDWRISKYSYMGQMADGGSIGFLFSIEPGNSFKLIAANGTYLTKDERTLGIEQSFFISVLNEEKLAVWFKVEKDSSEEKELLEKLETASRSATGVNSYDPRLLRTAIEHIKSRKELSSLARDNGGMAN